MINTCVVIFCYNRPKHTEKMLEALAQNSNSKKISLYIFCDGPKPNEDRDTIKNILEVRKIVSQISWCQQLKIVERPNNLGLGNSIRSGLNQVFSTYDAVIVLEDDLIPQEGFLNYMNFNLMHFRDNDEVYHIAGFQRDSYLNFFIDEIYYTHFMNCSGWGTWKDRWEKCNWNFSYWSAALENYQFKNRVDYDGYLRISEQINLNASDFKTWAIFWYLTILENNGLCVNPKRSYISNIGDDGSGTNMGNTKINNVKVLNYSVYPKPPMSMNFFETYISKRIIKEAYGVKSKIRLKSLKKLGLDLYYHFEKSNIR
jgi:hypothetical protein